MNRKESGSTVWWGRFTLPEGKAGRWRIDIEVGVAYKEGISRVREVMFEVARKNPLCLEEPAPHSLYRKRHRAVSGDPGEKELTRTGNRQTAGCLSHAGGPYAARAVSAALQDGELFSLPESLTDQA